MSDKNPLSDTRTRADLAPLEHARSTAIEGLRATVEHARNYAVASRAASTVRAYRVAWDAWAAWCRLQGLDELPAAGESVALYAAHLAASGSAVSSIELALVAINQRHRLEGHPSPRAHRAVSEVMRGIRRTHGVATKQKAALLVGAVKVCVKKLPSRVLGVRDRALLLVGFAGAFRRSELVDLDVEDLAFEADGVAIRIGRSKTDQEGRGRTVGVPLGRHAATCPVRALRAWLEVSGLERGALFVGLTRHGKLTGYRLSGRDVARIVKRTAARAGLDPAALAGHSLRSGFCTSAAKAGAGERQIMRQTGHKSPTMVRRYIRDAEVLADDNAARGLL